MTAVAVKNAAYSLVATAPSPATSGLTLTVTAGEGARFADPAVAGPYYVTLWPTGAQPMWAAGGATAGNFEIALCTARSGDVLTLTRAQQGTTARTVVIGDQVAATLDAQTFANAIAGAGVGIYGDGSDGTVTFDGSTTILGMAPSSSIYMLTRDFYFAAVTINNGVTIKTNGFRIFCAGTMTNNGIISFAGNAAANVNTGSNGANGNSSINNRGGTNGGLNTSGGVSTTTTGGAGDACGGNGYSFGGQGGAGGAGTSAAGAGGSTNALPTTALSQRGANPMLIWITAGNIGNPTQGGTGGGAGGGDGTNRGGGGGAGGGVVALYIKTFAGTGTITAAGGAGGNSLAGNTGGGGGGGGGLIVIVSSSISAGAISGQTITVAGGVGGTKQGTGVNGSTGAAGNAILLQN